MLILPLFSKILCVEPEEQIESVVVNVPDENHLLGNCHPKIVEAPWFRYFVLLQVLLCVCILLLLLLPPNIAKIFLIVWFGFIIFLTFCLFVLSSN